MDPPIPFEESYCQKFCVLRKKGNYYNPKEAAATASQRRIKYKNHKDMRAVKISVDPIAEFRKKHKRRLF